MNLSIRPVVAQYLFPCLMGVFSLSAQDNEYAAGLEEPVVLEAVHVHAEKGDQRSQAEQRLASIPGGVQLLPAERYLNGQAGNLADALRYAPGVYTGNEDGSQQVRLAVRGSGIQNRFGGAGLQFLYNGIPLNRADGGYETQSIDLKAIDYMEIYRGGNALSYGGAQLGGALNIVTPTGISRQGNQVDLAYGSWNTLRTQIQSGHICGENTDTYVSLGYLQSDGFRKNSDTQSTILNTSLGVQMGEALENRTWVSYSDGRRRLPGSLTVAEVYGSPRESLEPTREWRRDIEDFLLANRTTWTGEEAQLEASVFTTATHFRHPVSNAPFHFDFNDRYWTYGGALRGSKEYQLFGRQSELISGVNYAWTKAERRGTQPRFAPPFGRQTIHNDQRASQLELYAQNQTELVDGLQGIVGLQYTHANRRQKQTYDHDYDHVSPRLGLIYELLDTVEVYANYNWSYEPPRWGNLSDQTDIRPQAGETVELGIRGEYGATQFDLTWYRSAIKDRFIYVAIPPTPVAAMTNSDARQQGIELAASTNLTEWLDQSTQSYSVWFYQVFTWSDFRFHNDPIRGNNRMPIVPEFRYVAELMLELDNGFYIGPGVEWVFGERPIDNANSATVDGYAVVNLKAGYRAEEYWTLFVEARNLFDERYVSTMALNDRTTPDTRSFSPGEPFAVYAGINYKF